MPWGCEVVQGLVGLGVRVERLAITRPHADKMEPGSHLIFAYMLDPTGRSSLVAVCIGT